MAVWSSPYLLLSPREVSRIFMKHVWSVFGDGVDESNRLTKENLITPNATGVVLDIGAGFGHAINYLNHSKVTKYVAIEPNVNMHEQLRFKAAKVGYTESSGNLIILSCGAEDITTILSALDNTQVDTIISVLTLCTVPNSQNSITNLVLDVLKPGGTLLYIEHVLSSRKDIAWWQKLWAPLWAIGFDGCRMDRPTHMYIEEIKDKGGEGREIWKERSAWNEPGQDEENLFLHRVGRYVKV